MCTQVSHDLKERDIHMKRILLGMSGGVDSSAAAKILIDKGYDVTGATIKMFDRSQLGLTSETCGGENDVNDAAEVCRKLGIQHITPDFSETFKCCVMDSFVNSYLKGETPNPCIECNKYLKFGKMLEYALENGYDGIATGHYARCGYNENTGRYSLYRPADRSKDQSYVLYSLTQHQLEHTIFPLWGYEKGEIRKIAAQAGLINAEKPDSQDICFVPDGDYAGFILRNTEKAIVSGDMLDSEGNILTQHRGLIHYTIGQRKGLGIALGKPAYVVEKNAESNSVIIGNEDLLYKSVIYLRNVNWVRGEVPKEAIAVTAKTRYSQQESKAIVYPSENGKAKLQFEQPQRAPARGQAAVFYIGDEVLGGGTIDGTK